MGNRLLVIPRNPSLVGSEFTRISVIDNGDGTVSLFFNDGSDGYPSTPGGVVASGDVIKVAGSSFGNQTANAIFSGPSSGGAAAPAFRALVSDDIPSLAASKITSGTFPISRGGTNSAAALNNNRILVSSGGAIVEAGAMVSGEILIGSTGAAPVVAALTPGEGITILNGAGSITIEQQPATVNQLIRVAKAALLVGIRREVNFIEGSNVTLTVTDNAGGNRVDVTIAASAGAPGGSNKQVQINNSGAFGGATGFEYQSGASPNVLVTAQNSAHVPLVVRAAASQSVAIAEFQSSAGTALAAVSQTGCGQFANGDGSIMGIGFRNEVNTGFRSFTGIIVYHAGAEVCYFSTGKVEVGNAVQVAWNSAGVTSALDIGLGRHAAGILKITNGGGTNYFFFDGPNLIQRFGGTTASFPALKRSTTVLQVRLADDSAYAPLEASEYRVSTTKVVGARVTGWGAPTGTATRTTFDTTTVTTEQLAQRVKALIDDLTAHGLIGT